MLQKQKFKITKEIHQKLKKPVNFMLQKWKFKITKEIHLKIDQFFKRT